MEKQIYAAAILIPDLAYARTMPGEAIPIGIAIFFAPLIAGILIAGKGNTWWFFKIAIAVYAVSWFIAALVSGQATVITFLTFPYILLPISIYKRYNRSKNKNSSRL